MESLLNLVWVLISAFGMCAGLAHISAQRGRKSSIRHAVVALAIIAVLLFPVISLTDDLNPAMFSSEVLSRRNVLSGLVHAPTVHDVVLNASWLALSFSLLIVIGSFFEYACLAPERRGFALPFAGRAPPVGF